MVTKPPVKAKTPAKRSKAPVHKSHAAHEKARAVFLKELSLGWSVTWAAKKAGISRRTFYTWRDGEDHTGRVMGLVLGFKEAWDEAVEMGTDSLEDEGYRRATHGTDRPVFYQGEQCGSIREYSDNLLKFLLEGRRPDRFRAKPVENAGASNVAITVVGGLPERNVKPKE
jgi:hypothetical protein